MTFIELFLDWLKVVSVGVLIAGVVIASRYCLPTWLYITLILLTFVILPPLVVWLSVNG